jgi:hypothetical protein
MPSQLEEYEEEEQQAAMREYLGQDRVAQNVTYHAFVSRSKGWRNGKRRIRRRWKEVQLVRYTEGFHLWPRFPFDEYATEIIGPHADEAMLKERILSLERLRK